MFECVHIVKMILNLVIWFFAFSISNIYCDQSLLPWRRTQAGNLPSRVKLNHGPASDLRLGKLEAQTQLNPLKTVILSKVLSSKVTTEISRKEKKELSSRKESISQSSSSHVAETAIAQRYSDWSRPFGSFDLKCPGRHAVKSMKIRQISDGEAFDASFSIQCEIFNLNDELGEADIQTLTFRPLKDGSIQSPCDLSIDQFLCGIRGIYENDERGTEAHCCRYEKVRPSLRGNPVSDKPAVREIELKPSSKDQFIGNLDQTSDGTFVAQIIKFDIS